MTVHESLLVADFQQCFEHMRHYDETFRRTLEFGFAGVAVVISASTVLLGQYGLTRLTTTTVGLLLLVSSLAGFLLVVSLARNRVYFAFVGRYVNELRGLYLAQSPGGVLNKAGIYVNYKFPRVFSPASSHSIQVYFLSGCNSVLFAGAVAALSASHLLETNSRSPVDWVAVVVAFLLFMLVQLAWVLLYWCYKEKQKTADAAVFGREK